MTKALHPLAAVLLDTHVQWTIESLGSSSFDEQIIPLVRKSLAHAGQMKLKEVVKLSDLRKVALKYACEMPIGGVIPELVGRVARDIYGHKIHNETTLNDYLSDRRFDELMDKLLELESLREMLARQSVSNPVFSGLITELLTMALKEYAQRGTELTSRVPGAKSALKLGKRLADRARPNWSEEIDDNLNTFVQKQTAASLRASERFLIDMLGSEEFRVVVSDIWHDNKHRTISSIRDYAGSIDIEELFVIGYEHWQELREQKAVAALISAGVDSVYQHLGSYTLAQLLDEIGVSEDMIIEDVQRFAPHAIKALHKKKLLDPWVRDVLSPYYQSAALDAVLRKHAPLPAN